MKELPPIKRKRGRPRKIITPISEAGTVVISEKPPAKNGRPRAITPEMFPLIEKMAGKGWTNEQISSGLYVSSQTYRQYRNKDMLSEEDKLSLSLAIQKGRQAWWEKLDNIGDRLMDGPSGTVPWIFAKKQHAGGGWKDQQSIDHTGGITINVVRRMIGDGGEVIDITPQIEE